MQGCLSLCFTHTDTLALPVLLIPGQYRKDKCKLTWLRQGSKTITQHYRNAPARIFPLTPSITSSIFQKYLTYTRNLYVIGENRETRGVANKAKINQRKDPQTPCFSGTTSQSGLRSSCCSGISSHFLHVICPSAAFLKNFFFFNLSKYII